MAIEETCNGVSYAKNCVKKDCGFVNGSSSLRTYKRRKVLQSCASKFVDLENVSSISAVMNGKLVDVGLPKKYSEPICDPKINCHSLLNGSSDDCSFRHQKHVLQCISESLRPAESEFGGIQDSVIEVHKNPDTAHEKMAKDNVDHLSGESDFHRDLMLNRGSTAAEGPSAVTSNRLTNESSYSTVSGLCERALSNILMSGKFASLCKLLPENFHGVNIDKLLDFSLINIRMKDGTYERTPILFSSDIQQFWGRLNSIGQQMVSLSNNLSELSRVFCHELEGGTEADTSSGRKPEAPAMECKLQIKLEDSDASVLCICKQCGERSDESDCLVCDSCEAIFHVSCIEPAIKEIPHKSWYCVGCTSNGVESPHEDCVVCDRLKANSRVNDEINTVPLYDETLNEDETSDGIILTGPQVFQGNESLPCKSCGNNLTKGDKFFVCEHRFCPFKYYHIRCLSSKELKSYGPRWYCASCLCRVCLTDKDDDNIVMCDGCDHGYHIYCMNPPRTSIPRGKWFCPKCDAGIKTIRKVKKFYEAVESYKRNESGRGLSASFKKARSDNVDNLGGSGEMDMLSTADRTVNVVGVDQGDRST
ncbi:hypothetical protein RND81_02G088100 [Saponaria officinalis]|uniref:Uncharacterized protein n=1 Tax=Saponaria officinalis TaxID=3572 RepID=A0AAW1MKU6_SAPOF